MLYVIEDFVILVCIVPIQYQQHVTERERESQMNKLTMAITVL